MPTLSIRPCPVNCCPDDEPRPCGACPQGPDDDGICYDDAGPFDDPIWDGYDDERWTTKPHGLTMVEMVEREAREYRGWQTDLGDLLAERIEGLSASMRALDARTPEGYRDRRDAFLDSAAVGR